MILDPILQDLDETPMKCLCACCGQPVYNDTDFGVFCKESCRQAYQEDMNAYLDAKVAERDSLLREQLEEELRRENWQANADREVQERDPWFRMAKRILGHE